MLGGFNSHLPFRGMEVLAMMNVVTGVFVESALGSAREDGMDAMDPWTHGGAYDYDIWCICWWIDKFSFDWINEIRLDQIR